MVIFFWWVIRYLMHLIYSEIKCDQKGPVVWNYYNYKRNVRGVSDHKEHQPRQSLDSCTHASLQLDQEMDASVIVEPLILRVVSGTS